MILATPAYVFFFYVMYVDYWKSARSLAEYHLFNHMAGHAHLTNYGINFFLYVISGRKFRSDLLHLCKCGRIKESEVPSSNQSNITKDTSAWILFDAGFSQWCDRLVGKIKACGYRQVSFWTLYNSINFLNANRC